jgi:FKBP-type peptidyl-prolyl cis-trans isomerase (trigger factor)
MKTEVKKLDDTKREISIEVNGDIVKNKFEDVFKKISKEAKVRGFRTGHAPRDILEKQYSSLIQERVLKELLPEVYNEAIKRENLEVVGLPQISDVKLERSSFSFKANVEVYPEIKIKNYRGIKIQYKKMTVMPEEVKRNIDFLKEKRKINIIDDNLAKSLGYPNLAQLEEALEKEIFLRKMNSERTRIEDGIVENLLKDSDFKLPQSLVNKQLQELVRQAKVDLALRGITREKIDEQEKRLFSELEPEARKQVKIYLALSEIAKKENIPLDDDMPRRVLEFLLKEADWEEIKEV